MYLIEFPLEHGGSVVVEVQEPTSGKVRVARPGEIAATAGKTFESVLEGIKPAAEVIISKLRGLSEPPDTLTVEFGIKLNAQANLVIAGGGAEAHYKVTLTWTRK